MTSQSRTLGFPGLLSAS